MRCRKVCDLLRSDYLDGQVSDEQCKEVDTHLEYCPACRQLKHKLASQHILLRGIVHKEVPAEIWQNIQSAILAEQLRQKRDLFNYAWEGLKRLFYLPRPALVLATTVTVFMITLFTGRMLLNPPNPLSTVIDADVFEDFRLNGNTEIYNFGTAIEEYFL